MPLSWAVSWAVCWGYGCKHVSPLLPQTKHVVEMMNPNGCVKKLGLGREKPGSNVVRSAT